MPVVGEEICTRFSTWRERTPGDPLVRSEYDSVVWRGGFNLSAKQHSLITNNRLQGMGYLIGHHNPLTSISKCKCLRWPHTQLRQMKNSSSQQAKPILQSSSDANRCLRSSRIQLIQAGRIRRYHCLVSERRSRNPKKGLKESCLWTHSPSVFPTFLSKGTN